MYYEWCQWRTSSYTGGQGNCVEVADLADGSRLVRDTKDRDGSVLHFRAADWRRFTESVS